MLPGAPRLALFETWVSMLPAGWVCHHFRVSALTVRLAFPVYSGSMPWGLKRYYRDLHFIPCSLRASACALFRGRRDLFLTVLEQVRRKYHQPSALSHQLSANC